MAAIPPSEDIPGLKTPRPAGIRVIQPMVVKISTMNKSITVLMTYVALILIMVGFDVMTIVLSQFYLAGCGITAFNGLYIYQWGTVLTAILLCVSASADIGKQFAVVPYLIVSVLRVIDAYNMVHLFNVNPDRLLKDIGLAYNNAHISGAIGFYILSNLSIAIVHCYFPCALISYFCEDVVLRYFRRNRYRGNDITQV